MPVFEFAARPLTSDTALILTKIGPVGCEIQLKQLVFCAALFGCDGFISAFEAIQFFYPDPNFAVQAVPASEQDKPVEPTESIVESAEQVELGGFGDFGEF